MGLLLALGALRSPPAGAVDALVIEARRVTGPGLVARDVAIRLDRASAARARC